MTTKAAFGPSYSRTRSFGRTNHSVTVGHPVGTVDPMRIRVVTVGNMITVFYHKFDQRLTDAMGEQCFEMKGTLADQCSKKDGWTVTEVMRNHVKYHGFAV